MTAVARQMTIRADAARLYDEFAKASCLAAWLGPAHFKVNQQFGSVMLKLCGELDFAVSETRSPVTITWKCMTKRHAWTNSRVLFAFASIDDGVLVSVTHEGIADGDSYVAVTESFWDSMLGSLNDLVEKGVGSPITSFPAELRRSTVHILSRPK